MASAVFFGVSSGALHAVTGPDHVLSLGPVALRRPPAAWRIGLLWGAGHALGTALLSVAAFAVASQLDLQVLAAWGERCAGAALIALAAWSWRASRSPAPPGADVRRPLVVGFIHGLTGAASLLLLAPVLVSGSGWKLALFIASFGLGSTLAMAAFTSLLARVGTRLAPRWIARAQRVLLLASVTLGVVWLAS